MDTLKSFGLMCFQYPGIGWGIVGLVGLVIFYFKGEVPPEEYGKD